LELYFRCDFDIFCFKKQHSTEIFQTIVRNYVNNLDPDDFLHLYEEMLKNVRMDKIITIAPDYPLERLVPVMKPFINMYLFSKYTCDRQLENNVSYELCYRLKTFVRKNPLFGRKIYKACSKYSTIAQSEIKEQFTFIHAKPRYLFATSDLFLRNHLYNETDYNSYIFRGHLRTEPNEEMSSVSDDGYQPVFSNRDNTVSSSGTRSIRRRISQFTPMEDYYGEEDDLITIAPRQNHSTHQTEERNSHIYFDTSSSDENSSVRQNNDIDGSSDEESVYEDVLNPSDTETEQEDEEEEDYDW
jgi:hypothetical protein